MIIVEMWLLGSLSGEATSTLSDVHTHACYCFFRTVSGTHASLACTAVLCRTSKLMGGGEKKYLNEKKEDRLPDLMRGMALVVNVCSSNCPYFSSNPYIFKDMNIGKVRPVLAPIKAVWRPRAVQIPPGEYMLTLSHWCHLKKNMED